MRGPDVGKIVRFVGGAFAGLVLGEAIKMGVPKEIAKDFGLVISGASAIVVGTLAAFFPQPRPEIL